MCHHRRHLERTPERVGVPAPPSGPLRVGDAERERVAAILRDHAAAGRLEPAELEERLERTYGARYGSDLEVVLAELPPEPEPLRRSRPARPRPTPAPLFPIALAALIALAAITGAWWLLWLIWPLAIALGPKRHYRRARI